MLKTRTLVPGRAKEKKTKTNQEQLMQPPVSANHDGETRLALITVSGWDKDGERSVYEPLWRVINANLCCDAASPFSWHV